MLTHSSKHHSRTDDEKRPEKSKRQLRIQRNQPLRWMRKARQNRESWLKWRTESLTQKVTRHWGEENADPVASKPTRSMTIEYWPEHGRINTTTRRINSQTRLHSPPSTRTHPPRTKKDLKRRKEQDTDMLNRK